MIERLPTWARKPWLHFALMAILLAPIPAPAAIYLVNATEDTQDILPGDGICADISGNCTLRAAVQEANAWTGPDTIQLPAGTYLLSIPGNAEHAAATGDLDITQGLSILGAGPASTIIDAGGIDRIFETIHAGAVNIEGLSLQNGVAGANTPGYFVNQVGGAISNVGDTSTLTLRNVIVRNNSATAGGGVYNIFSTLHIYDSTFHDNQATNGNGGGLSEGLAAFTRLYNVTLSGNSATGSGGGMSTSNNTALLNNVTVTNNLADSDNDGSGNGGGIARGITAATVSNSIVAENQDLGGEAPDCADSLNSAGYNLIGNNTGCSITTATGDQIGTGGAPLTASLAPLALDGGATPLHAVLNGSLARDAGSTATPGSGSGACEATDQRGNARVNAAPCDIGAYEASGNVGLVFTVNSTDDLVDAIIGDGLCETVPSNNQCTLRAAIQEANARIGADTINLPAGLYRLTLAGSDEDAAATGDLDIDDVVTIIGDTAATTIIDADHIDRVIEVRMAGGLNLSNATIQNGLVTGSGGGIKHQASGNLTLTDCIVTGNSANGAGGSGGGVFSVAFTTLTINKCIIRNNSANAYGGGVANFTFSTALISDTRITGNMATSTGGGLMNSFMSNVTITNSTLDNNQSQQGGGIGTRWGNGVVTLINATLSGNTGTLDGGGAYVATNDTLNLRNATIANNQVQNPANGGGIANYGTVNTRNSLIAENTDAGGEAPNCSGTIFSQGYNLIGDDTGCSLAASTGDQIGTSTSPLNSLIGPLSDNGGTTPTHVLLIGSSALNAANPAPAGSGGTACETFDQRGIDRSLNTPCDIGAVELPIADLAVALTTSSNPAEPGAAVEYVVSLTNNGPDSAHLIELSFLMPQTSVLNNATAAGWSCSTTSGLVICTGSTLPSAASNSLRFDVTLGATEGNWTVTAYARSASIDPDSSNDSLSLSQSVMTLGSTFKTIQDSSQGAILMPSNFYKADVMDIEAVQSNASDLYATGQESSVLTDPESVPMTQEAASTSPQNDNNATQPTHSSYGLSSTLESRAQQAMQRSHDSDFASLGGIASGEANKGTELALNDPALWLALDTMKSNMKNSVQKNSLDRDLFIDVAQTTSIFIAAGLTNWYLKSSALLASVLSTLPLWSPFDPLPILALSRRERKKRKASAEAEREAENRAGSRLGALVDSRPRGLSS